MTANGDMIVLGIETSCDETSVAVVTGAREILSHQILSQKEHKLFGGVVPEVAARAHLAHLAPMVTRALDESGKTLDDLSGIAVTAGPGLIGGVLVGVMAAKAVAAVKNLPIVGVNHLEGHALTARLSDDVAFPYLLLLVSGGHCQLLVAEGVGQYKRLGGTIDDAVGEAFDKVAKMMGLGYPGGPHVEKMAALCADPARAVAQYPLPRPLMHAAGCDFSFSGLKTAVKRLVDAQPPGDLPQVVVSDICHAFQQAVADVLVDRVMKAMEMCHAPALVVAGGVAANKKIGAALKKVADDKGVRFVAPPLKLCTDNAAMIAWAGLERLRRGLADNIDFAVHPRWPLDPAAAEKGTA